MSKNSIYITNRSLNRIPSIFLNTQKFINFISVLIVSLLKQVLALTALFLIIFDLEI